MLNSTMSMISPSVTVYVCTHSLHSELLWLSVMNQGWIRFAIELSGGAPSAEPVIAPINRPCRTGISSSHDATRPVKRVVPRTPRVASISAGRSTARHERRVVRSPPSKRMIASVSAVDDYEPAQCGGAIGPLHRGTGTCSRIGNPNSRCIAGRMGRACTGVFRSREPLLVGVAGGLGAVRASLPHPRVQPLEGA
jgi:hypothetical protein